MGSKPKRPFDTPLSKGIFGATKKKMPFEMPFFQNRIFFGMPGWEIEFFFGCANGQSERAPRPPERSSDTPLSKGIFGAETQKCGSREGVGAYFRVRALCGVRAPWQLPQVAKGPGEPSQALWQQPQVLGRLPMPCGSCRMGLGSLRRPFGSCQEPGEHPPALEQLPNGLGGFSAARLCESGSWRPSKTGGGGAAGKFQNGKKQPGRHPKILGCTSRFLRLSFNRVRGHPVEGLFQKFVPPSWRQSYIPLCTLLTLAAPWTLL